MEIRRVDIKPEGFNQPEVALLYGLIENAFKRLTRLTGEMTQEELEYRGQDGARNSTATLIAHLAANDLEWVFRFLDQEIPADLQAIHGAMMTEGQLPEVKGLTAQELLDRYQQVLTMLKEYLQTLTAADLDRTILVEPTVEVTVRWALWHFSSHSVFHQGHIVWLKQWFRAQQEQA